MPGLFLRLKSWFTPTPKNLGALQPVSKKAYEQKMKGKVLDPSSSVSIELPRVPKTNFEEGRKPPEYWEIYNKGVSLYTRKWYGRARAEFLKLLDYENPHQTFYTYLLRTYRKILADLIEKKKFADAHEAYGEFFDICGEHVTDTDRRNYNKLVDQLSQNKPGVQYQKVALIGRKKEPEYEIDASDQYVLAMTREIKFGKEERPGKKDWNFIGRIDSGVLYVGCAYNKELSKYDSSVLVLRNRSGDLEREFTVDHGIYRFKTAEDASRFVASSDDLVLYLYSMREGCLGTCDLKGYADDKRHVRCVDISPEGQFLLFTHIDLVYLMDASLRVINDWKTPAKEGWERRTDPGVSERTAAGSEGYRRQVAVLGLSGEPAKEEIKRAYRAMLHRYHPDRNPDDPTATEKTREIIAAYEGLTGEDAKQAFVGVENAEYYYRLIDQMKIEVPGTSVSFTLELGMVGPGEDWIYATCLGPQAERIYLGCYSGKVYCITKDGHVVKRYDCHDTVRSIREKGDRLFIETDYCLFILMGDRYFAHVHTWKAGDVRWNKSGFMLVGTKTVRLFTDEGAEIGSISFKNNIYDTYEADGAICVITARKVYTFSVS